MTDPVRTGPVCALILAGGRSRRMGTDKAVLSLEGRTLLQRAADFWQAQPGIDAVLAAVGTEDHLPELPEGVIPVYDRYPGRGPMAGLHAAFAATDAQLLYVSAVDMPRLRGDALLPPPAGDAAVYLREGKPEPLFGVYRRSILPALEDALSRDRNKLRVLLEQLDVTYVPLPADMTDAVSNLNTPADLLRARAGTPPTLVFMGWSGSGKTTFLEKLIPELTARGLRVSVVKHDAHGFQMDKPGKDTYRFAAAGAAGVAISGPSGWAVLSPEDIRLDELKAKLPPSDLILVEGHKYSGYPKIEIHRRATGKPFITHDDSLVAAVTDEPLDVPVPQLGLEDIGPCADLILNAFFPERSSCHEG